MPGPGRKNQFADAGCVASTAADSSRSVVKVVFFIALSCEFGPFRTAPHKGQQLDTMPSHTKETRRWEMRVPSGTGSQSPAEGTKCGLPKSIAAQAKLACAAIQPCCDQRCAFADWT